MKERVKQFMRENLNYSVFNAETFEMFMVELKRLAQDLEIDIHISGFVSRVYEIFYPPSRRTISILRQGLAPALVANVTDENYDRVLEATIKMYGRENVRGSK